VPTDDVKSVLSANGYQWGGTNVKIEMLTPSGPRSDTKFSFHNSTSSEQSSHSPAELRAIFRAVITRRYDANVKLIDLSQICNDPDLKTLGIGPTLGPRSKLLQALLVVVDEIFKTRQEKKEKVQFLTLKENGLEDVSVVTAVAQAFPDVLNLDLSYNKLASMKSISRWQHKFRHLEQIVLKENPLEQNEPDFVQQLIRWYPNLKMIDLAEIPAEVLHAARARKPIPKVQVGRFEDQGGVAEGFLKNFFAGYDQDRKALADYYYDSTSRFSLDVNTHALRDPSTASQKMATREWDSYLRHSRNLTKITNLPARMRRSHQGTTAISDIFTQLPATRHPDFAAEPQKWLVECQTMRCVPDPSGANPGGVNGLIITVHGEFEEVDSKKVRSFDRTFILGPGGPNGVRVVNDMITIRAYGGIKAFEAEPAAPVDNEAAQQQMIVLEIMKRTGMNQEYALMCFQESNHDFAEAMANFEKAKASIPPAAFVQ
jgi:nuclear RNA export factor